MPEDLKIPNIFENSDNEKSEYLVAVDWIHKVPSNKVKWNPKSELFASQLIKASLQNQKVTREFLEEEFGIDLRELLLQDVSSLFEDGIREVGNPIAN